MTDTLIWWFVRLTSCKPRLASRCRSCVLLINFNRAIITNEMFLSAVELCINFSIERYKLCCIIIIQIKFEWNCKRSWRIFLFLFDFLLCMIKNDTNLSLKHVQWNKKSKNVWKLFTRELLDVEESWRSKNLSIKLNSINFNINCQHTDEFNGLLNFKTELWKKIGHQRLKTLKKLTTLRTHHSGL